jgi:hypothetical protein
MPLEDLPVVPMEVPRVRVELPVDRQPDLLTVELLEQAPGRATRQDRATRTRRSSRTVKAP